MKKIVFALFICLLICSCTNSNIKHIYLVEITPSVYQYTESGEKFWSKKQTKYVDLGIIEDTCINAKIVTLKQMYSYEHSTLMDSYFKLDPQDKNTEKLWAQYRARIGRQVILLVVPERLIRIKHLTPINVLWKTDSHLIKTHQIYDGTKDCKYLENYI